MRLREGTPELRASERITQLVCLLCAAWGFVGNDPAVVWIGGVGLLISFLLALAARIERD
jgi:hypothetical protein